MMRSTRFVFSSDRTSAFPRAPVGPVIATVMPASLILGGYRNYDSPVADVRGICEDLRAERESLDALVRDLTDADWDTPTPAEGWNVRDQISHLTFFDEQATLAAGDPDAFNVALAEITELDVFMNAPLQRGRAMSPAEVLVLWRQTHEDMQEAFAALDPSTRVPWYGPPMSPASFVTARVMETWAHGQDVVDALGLSREPTDRLRHVCFIGVRARRNSYASHGLELPADEVRVELTGPGGDRWAWNEDAVDSVVGDALDFCLVVTQRRHPADTGLVIDGPLATEWMSIAQAFAGPPGPGRAPGQFPRETA